MAVRTLQALAKKMGFSVPSNRDFPIHQAVLPTLPERHAITIITRENEDLSLLFGDAPGDVLVVALESLADQATHLPQVFHFAKNPRLEFCRAANFLFPRHATDGISPKAVVQTPTPLGPEVQVGSGSHIAGDITIGQGTIIESNVVIMGKVDIGREAYIKSGTVIGQSGFGFERDENEMPIRFPQLGGVRLGDRVEIGALTTIARGALGDTVVEDDVKIDDRVHIGHNCRIGKGTMITACSEISGSVKIGQFCYLGPNCSVIDHITIGDRAFIGIGCVVANPVPPHAILAARPATLLGRREIPGST